MDHVSQLEGYLLAFIVSLYFICRKLRQLDNSTFHIQLSIAMLGMLLVFLIGSEVKVDVVCTIVSILIQYFSLASVLWMGAEAVLMFQKLVLVMRATTRKFIIVVSLICWCKKSMFYIIIIQFAASFVTLSTISSS